MKDDIKPDNMELWNQVCETNPDDTKPFTGKGGFKGTAVAAQTQRKKGTELWGPFGTKWGIKNESFEILKLSEDPHDNIIAYHGFLFYPGGEVGIHSDLSIFMYVAPKGERKGYWLKNNDIHKKVRTDAFTKGLSELGFNADIFLGLFDDNKYVKAMTKRFKGIQPEQEKKINQLIKDTNTDTTKFNDYLQKVYSTTNIGNLNTEDAKEIIPILEEKLKDAKNN